LQRHRGLKLQVPVVQQGARAEPEAQVRPEVPEQLVLRAARVQRERPAVLEMLEPQMPARTRSVSRGQIRSVLQGQIPRV
jgi:hypothetical protein